MAPAKTRWIADTSSGAARFVFLYIIHIAAFYWFKTSIFKANASIGLLIIFWSLWIHKSCHNSSCLQGTVHVSIALEQKQLPIRVTRDLVTRDLALAGTDHQGNLKIFCWPGPLGGSKFGLMMGSSVVLFGSLPCWSSHRLSSKLLLLSALATFCYFYAKVEALSTPYGLNNRVRERESLMRKRCKREDRKK